MGYMGTYHRLGVHVGASNRTVIRSLWRKMAAHCKHERKYREARHKAYADILACHESARLEALT